MVIYFLTYENKCKITLDSFKIFRNKSENKIRSDMDMEDWFNSTYTQADEENNSVGGIGKFKITPMKGIQFLGSFIALISCISACIRCRKRRLERQRRLTEAAAVPVDGDGSEALDMSDLSAPPVSDTVSFPRQTSLTTDFTAGTSASFSGFGFGSAYGGSTVSTLSSRFTSGATAPSSGYGFGSPYGECAAPSGGYTYTNTEFKY